MFNEEIEMTLECAVKIRKHLMRSLDREKNEELESQLHYVNNIIVQADTLQYEMTAVA